MANVERGVELTIAYSLAFASAATASLYGLMSATGPYGVVKAVGLFGVAFVGCHGPAWMVKAKQRLGWPGVAFGAVVTAVCLVTTLAGGLGTNASGGSGIRAERTKQNANVAADRVELARLVSARQAMPTFAPATADTVTAAREAVTAAEAIRARECGNGELRQRGPNCRLRETEEQAKRDALTAAEANKAATDHAAKLDANAAAIRAQLNTAQAPQDADPQASAFSSLTGLSVDFAIALYAFWLSLAFELSAMFTMLIAYSGASEMPSTAVAASPALAVNQTPAPLEVEAVVDRPALPSPRMLDADAKLIARFMIQCLPRCTGEQAMRGAVYKRFLRWCEEQTPPAAAPDTQAFWAHFEPLCERVGIKLRTKAGKVYCVGVKLAA